MSDQDYTKVFVCPKCGRKESLYLLKVNSQHVIIKQRCPTHGGRSFKVPLRDLYNYIDLIKDSILRCYKCGERTHIDREKFKGPWALVKGYCPTHKNGLPKQKIWSAVYAIASRMEFENIKERPNKQRSISKMQSPKKPKIVEKTPISSQKRMYCGNCGNQIEGMEKFCSFCGKEL
ncbi:MAG: hypothetical protein GF317_08540 [Candidatus Lokiarchaeota archaeon]|nr:hypothetical protein [Candidatus Lokiarchaeota archaeon]MBD3199762.1 hypothetical protein [Candidatus Lokiarchaeota archaeon]